MAFKRSRVRFPSAPPRFKTLQHYASQRRLAAKQLKRISEIKIKHMDENGRTTEFYRSNNGAKWS